MLANSLAPREHRPGAYGPKVRVMCRPAAAPSCDLVVQVADGLTWKDVRKFNDFSDSCAHLNADRLARQLKEQM